MATCLVLQHGEPECAYAIGDALRAAGVAIEVCRTYAGDLVPVGCADFDGLVVMGGGMSAASDDDFPTRQAELALLADAVGRGIPTLGVCLGAQLLAVAAGGRAFPGPSGLEVAWAPIWLTGAAARDELFAGAPPSFTVLHWHGDTFDLPAGAVHLVAGDRYQNQAFRVGDRAWGIQFHLEIDRDGLAAFVADFANEAAAAPGGVSGAIADAALAEVAPTRALLLGHFAGLVARSDRSKQTVTQSSDVSVA